MRLCTCLGKYFSGSFVSGLSALLRPASCCVFLLFAAVAPAHAAQDKPLKIGMDRDYAPFSSPGEQNIPTGFTLELAQAMCEVTGRECAYVLQSLDVLKDLLRRGEIDVLMNVRATQDMSSYAQFSRPYLHSRSVYVGKPSALRQDKTLRIGVRKGGAHHAYLVRTDRHTPAEIVEGEPGALLRELAENTLDMVLTNALHAYAFLVSGEGREFDLLGEPLAPEVMDAGLRMAVSSDKELLEELNVAIDAVHFNGMFLKINRKFFPYSLY